MDPVDPVDPVDPEPDALLELSEPEALLELSEPEAVLVEALSELLDSVPPEAVLDDEVFRASFL